MKGRGLLHPECWEDEGEVSEELELDLGLDVELSG
jgi:hypothetical protein